MNFRFLLAAVLLVATLTAHAQSAFQAHAIEAQQARPVLDGRLDEPVWQSAPVWDRFYQTQPFDRVEAPVRTEVRVLYDAHALYIGIVAHDPQPQAMRAPFARRDKIGADQDFLGLYLDPTGAHKSAQVFYVNPRGAINDGFYTDTNGDDLAPDFDFDVATARLEDGWSAEFRIPFSSLAFDPQRANWNLLVMRNFTREERYRLYSGMVTRATSCNLCASAPLTGLSTLPEVSHWSLTPQWVMERSRTDDAGGTLRTQEGRLSLDAKFRPSPSSIVDLTWHPDFSQVELDAPQLSGNSRFSLALTEKRPFFLEGTDMLRTPMNALYTRTLSDPSWGVRYTRRERTRDFTALYVTDQAGGDILLPGTYGSSSMARTVESSVLLARGTWRLDRLSIGTLLSERRYAHDLGENSVLGIDAAWQRDDNERWRAQWLFSSTDALPDSGGTLARGARQNDQAGFLDASLGNDQWYAYLKAQQIGAHFRDDNGFFPQNGFAEGYLEIGKKLGRGAYHNELNLLLFTDRKYTQDGRLLSSDLAPGLWYAGAYDSQLTLWLSPGNRIRTDANQETRSARQLRASYSISPGARVAKLWGDVTLGEVVDTLAARVGKGGALSFNARLKPLDRLELEPTLAYSWIDGGAGFVDRPRLYRERAAQLNGVLHFSAQDTLRLILQYAHTERNASYYDNSITPRSERRVASWVYTHTQGLGRALYLGVSSGDSNRFDPTIQQQQRSVFIKGSWRI